MYKNMYKKMIVLTIVVAGVLLVATPAKAFYLELPNILKFWQGTTKAQEAPTLAPAPIVAEPAPTPTPAPVPVPAPEPQPAPPMPYPTDPMPQPQPTPVPGEPMPAPQPPQPQPTCRVNGVDMPGSCDQYNNQLNNKQPMQGGGEGGQMGGQMDETMQQQNQERRLKDTQRGAKQWELQLKEFERAKKSYEKGGGVVEQSTNDDLQKAKDIIQAIKNAKTNEELDAVAGDELNGLMQSLEENRRDIFEAKQRLDSMKRGMKGMISGLKQFEKQVANLTKKKIVVPTEITDNLTKLRTIMDVVNAAKTWEEAEAAGIEDMQDLMQTVDEGRQQLEMLARWPQTLKQINNELKNLDRQLKKDKTIVDRLAKKEIDMTANYEGFAAAIAKLKAVRDDATAKIAAGDSEGAFDAIENDFFGQMEDVWQFDKVIQTMNNLGQFKSEFKRGITQAQQTIKKLEKKKLDVTAVKEALQELQDKGNAILAILKTKDFDAEVLIGDFDELQNLGQDLQDKLNELMGGSEDMPWEQGPQQFKQVQMPSTVSRYLPKKTIEVKQAVQQPMQQQTNVIVQ